MQKMWLVECIWTQDLICGRACRARVPALKCTPFCFKSIFKTVDFFSWQKNTENTIFKQKIRNIGIFNSFYMNHATLQNSQHWRKNWKIRGKWKLKNLWQTFNHNHSIWNAAIINTQNSLLSEHFLFNSNYLIKYYIHLKINPFFKFLPHSRKIYIDKHLRGLWPSKNRLSVF